MATYFMVAVLAAGVSFGLTAWFRALAIKRGIFTPAVVDRDSHRLPTPRIGGLALVVSFLLITGLWLIWRPEQLTLGNRQILGLDSHLLGLLVAIVFMTTINLADDRIGVHWRIKLFGQIIAAGLIVIFGISIQSLTNPFGELLIIGQWSPLLVILWLVIMMNVTNWLDGLNGLAGGVGLIALVVILTLALRPTVAQPEVALMAAIGIGAVVGFLPHNLLGRVFLGDTGSVFLGLLIGVLAIISGGKVATAFLVMAIPLLDGAVVFFSRIVSGQSPFIGDRRHLHHRLLAIGWRPSQIVGLFYSVSLLFGLIALNSQAIGKFWAILFALGLMGGLVALTTMAGKIVARDQPDG